MPKRKHWAASLHWVLCNLWGLSHWAENKQHQIKPNSNLSPANKERWQSPSSCAANSQGSNVTAAWEHSSRRTGETSHLLSRQNLGCRHRSNPGNPWRRSRRFSNGRIRAGKQAALLWWQGWCGPGAANNKNLWSGLTGWHFLWINDPERWADSDPCVSDPPTRTTILFVWAFLKEQLEESTYGAPRCLRALM